MLLKDTFRHTPFFMLILFLNGRFEDPFKIQWAPKWDPKSTKWRQIVDISRKHLRLLLFLTHRSFQFWKSRFACQFSSTLVSILRNYVKFQPRCVRILPRTSMSTIASTHLPRIHPQIEAQEIPDRTDTKWGCGSDWPLAASIELATHIYTCYNRVIWSSYY